MATQGYFISRNNDHDQLSFHRNEYLNLPDLQFFLWCQDRYRVNRGVYNTIDCWFYTNGIVSITNRRIYIIAFLDFVLDSGEQDNHYKYIRFGNGGLTVKLHQFTKSIEKRNIY
ncbi:hypothetical protein R4Z09_22230 [Niallia oryzisoli]|uniref:LAGLIDADG homing endonuclease n=1 Tax=Niallia oryzisoli TaxID=1737571 RepID=A0ABZ2C8L8_9BACI